LPFCGLTHFDNIEDLHFVFPIACPRKYFYEYSMTGERASVSRDSG
jgi:hypothetical protein